MISTKNSLLKYFADKTGINAKFSRKQYDIINMDPEYFVSPVDATLFCHGDIDDEGRIISKHGKSVSLDKLIGSHADKFRGGVYLNLYLSPKNKHYFVMPYDGTIIHVQKNEGEAIIPVIIGLDNIFGNQRWFSKAAEKNASIGIVINSEEYNYGMIAVGSLNVNNISVDCKSNSKYEKGKYIGHFSVGSTMILCFDKKTINNAKILLKDNESTTIGKEILKFK